MFQGWKWAFIVGAAVSLPVIAKDSANKGKVATVSAADHQMHKGHAHKHDEKCGHKAIKKDGYTNYEHDDHLHVADGSHYDEHHAGEHSHKHGKGCGHEVVLHNGHEDYMHDGHKHFAKKNDYAEH